MTENLLFLIKNFEDFSTIDTNLPKELIYEKVFCL